ncbi:MAG TPA: hypothetical protein VFS43_03940 [Polyangiaceae bacterium]|nr:hypothetical protein [Polyangiaceae bacterium]
MKRALRFDPSAHDYRPASVRAVLAEWADVDWFEPPYGGRAGERGVRLFEAHLALVCALRPGAVAPRAEVQAVAGGWLRFSALCERVRQNHAWDWKYSALKPLSVGHSEARGFRREGRVVAGAGSLPDSPLFVRHADTIFWVPPFREDGEGATAALPREHAADAAWYRSYADMDVYECLEWQFADPKRALEANPFYALLRCYAEGWYPFALGPASFVLFAFVGRPRP